MQKESNTKHKWMNVKTHKKNLSIIITIYVFFRICMNEKKKSNLVKDQCVYIRDEEIKSHSSFTYHKIQQLYTSQIPFSISPTRTHTHTHDRMFCIKNNYFSIIYLFDSFKFVFVSKKNPNQKENSLKNVIIIIIMQTFEFYLFCV